LDIFCRQCPPGQQHAISDTAQRNNRHLWHGHLAATEGTGLENQSKLMNKKENQTFNPARHEMALILLKVPQVDGCRMAPYIKRTFRSTHEHDPNGSGGRSQIPDYRN
jgi:hypothetical protein